MKHGPWEALPRAAPFCTVLPKRNRALRYYRNMSMKTGRIQLFL